MKYFEPTKSRDPVTSFLDSRVLFIFDKTTLRMLLCVTVLPSNVLMSRESIPYFETIFTGFHVEQYLFLTAGGLLQKTPPRRGDLLFTQLLLLHPSQQYLSTNKSMERELFIAQLRYIPTRRIGRNLHETANICK